MLGVQLPAPSPTNAHCPGGYFTATVDDGFGAGVQPGIFGMAFELDAPGSRLLHGGINFGALIDAGQVGFAGVNIANARGESQHLNLRLYGDAATVHSDDLPVTIQIERRTGDQRKTVYTAHATLSLTEPFEASISVPPGYYLATVAVTGFGPDAIGGPAEGVFLFSLTTSYLDRAGGAFQGGAVVGGYHASNPFDGVSGFAGICLDAPHNASVQVYSAPTFGESGARDLQLRVIDSERRPIFTQPAGPFSNVVDRFETTGPVSNLGEFALAQDANDLPVIGYLDRSLAQLRVARCTDQACAERSISNIAPAGDLLPFRFGGIAVDQDDLPVLSYVSGLSVFIAKCADPNCVEPVDHNQVYTAEFAANTLTTSALIIPTDGLPVTALRIGLVGVQEPFLPRRTELLKCADPACTQSSVNLVSAPTGIEGRRSALTIASDGNPLLTYHSVSNGLLTAHCSDPQCAGAIVRGEIEAPPSISSDDYLLTRVAIGVDGNPVVASARRFGHELRVAHCVDPSCLLPATQTTVDSNVDGSGFSLAIGNGGTPLLLYRSRAPAYQLQLLSCGSADCSADNPSPTALPVAGRVRSQLLIGSDGLPLIAHDSFIGDELRALKCATDSCR